jgi:hypothetical protein
MPEIQTATYSPFRGYMNSVESDLIPRDRITDRTSSAQSKNVLVDPLAGCLVPRLGIVIEGDTAATPAGLLESKWGSRSRQMWALKSPSIADGYPVPACLLTNEATGEGTVYWRDITATVNRQLGADFSASRYPVTASPPEIGFVMPPLKARHSPTSAFQRRDYTRSIDAIQRKILGAGSRRRIEVGDGLYLPAYQGTPLKWNKRSDGTTRIRPWGNNAPLLMPTWTATAGAGNNWPANKFYAGSIAYLHQDGSISMPIIPRAKNARLANGYGLFSTGAGGADYFTITNIPIGPGGPNPVVGRLILRTPGAATALAVDLSDLRIAGTIRNNTATSYVDTNGSDTDAAIPKDQILVRFDHVFPWRSRYAMVADERVFLGYLRPNPEAIAVCWVSPDLSGTIQNVADNAAYTVTAYASAVHQDQTGAKTTYFRYGDGTAYTSLDLATYTTLQDLVDQINSKAPGSANPTFRAGVVPGVDANAPTAQLDLTLLTIPSVTDGDATITPQGGKDFTDVQVGMRVYGHADIPAGTYVKSNAAGVITLGTAAGADQTGVGSTGNVTLKFGWETGDANPGEFRNFGNSYEVFHAFKESYLDTFSTEPRGVMFTSAEPGHARNAGGSFYSTIPHLEASAEAGILVGLAALSNLTNTILGLAIYSNAIYRIENPRGGNTALDADIRMRPLNKSRGCIAEDSIVEGDGWVGYMTDDGYVVTDGLSERVISRDVWNVANPALGEFGQEIGLSRASVARDGDDSNVHALNYGGRLHLSYRKGVTGIPNRRLLYDYSPGISANGLQEVMLSEREAYGWSAPLIGTAAGTGRNRPSCMCAVARSDGTYLYFWDDGNVGSTGDGMLQRFDVPATYTDNGADYTTGNDVVVIMPHDRGGTTLKKTAHVVRALVAKASGTALTVQLIRDAAGATATTVLTVPSGDSGTLPIRYRRDVPVELRSLSDTLRLQAFAVTAFDFRLYGFELDFEVMAAGVT